MKRSWFGLGILIVLLLGAFGVTWAMETTHAPAAQALERSAGALTEGDWPQARRDAEEGERLWRKYTPLRRFFGDQSFIEEVDAAFARLKIAAALDQREEFALLCAEIAQKIAALAEAHALNWGNLF